MASFDDPNNVANNWTGTTDYDQMFGKGGNDVINPLWTPGGSFATYDFVNGGADFDTLVVNASSESQDITAEPVSGPTTGSYSLSSPGYVFNVVAQEIEAVNITGGTGDDTLKGLGFNNSSDTLNGGDGNDYLVGFNGFDTFHGGSGTDTIDNRFWGGNVQVHLATGETHFTGFTQFETLTSIENFLAGNGFDTLAGNGEANVLSGGGGNDAVNGLNGNDRLFGDGGDDTLNGGNESDILYGGNNDDELLGGSGGDELHGENGIDDLRGGSGADVLDGGAGLDKLDGGDDADYADYRTSTGSITVDLAAGRAFFSGQAGFETLRSIEGALMGTGSDRVTGTSGGNTLFGGGGGDKLYGGAGNDRLNGDGLGNFLTNSPGADAIDGGSGDDTLLGYKGKDTLTGGLGKDILVGEDHADGFDFNTLNDSPSNGGRDIIRDFGRSEGDRIDLSTIDANYHKGGNQAFNFIGRSAFTDKEGQLHFVKKSGGVYVEGDVNGDGRADFQILVQGVQGLDRGDFIL